MKIDSPFLQRLIFLFVVGYIVFLNCNVIKMAHADGWDRSAVILLICTVIPSIVAIITAYKLTKPIFCQPYDPDD